MRMSTLLCQLELMAVHSLRAASCWTMQDRISSMGENLPMAASRVSCDCCRYPWRL